MTDVYFTTDTLVHYEENYARLKTNQSILNI
jgi:hypothetical protein